MTVYTTKADDITSCRETCNVCGVRLLWHPWIEWHGRENFAICGSCVGKIKTGLMADLIQCAAILDMQKLYRDCTLERQNVKPIEDRAQKNPDVARLMKK